MMQASHSPLHLRSLNSGEYDTFTLSIERSEYFFEVVGETADNEFTELLPPAS
jgi:hypothetical protein